MPSTVRASHNVARRAKDLFPSLRSHIARDFDVDLTDSSLVLALLEAADRVLFESSSLREQEQTALAILSDVDAARQSLSAERALALLDHLQLLVGMQVATKGLAAGDLSATHEWLLRALGITYGGDDEYEIPIDAIHLYRRNSTDDLRADAAKMPRRGWRFCLPTRGDQATIATSRHSSSSLRWSFLMLARDFILRSGRIRMSAFNCLSTECSGPSTTHQARRRTPGGAYFTQSHPAPCQRPLSVWRAFASLAPPRLKVSNIKSNKRRLPLRAGGRSCMHRSGFNFFFPPRAAVSSAFSNTCLRFSTNSRKSVPRSTTGVPGFQNGCSTKVNHFGCSAQLSGLLRRRAK